MKQQLEPQNIDAERALLGAVFVDPDCLYDVIDICDADDFYRPEHQSIFSAFHALSSKLEPIDILTVTDYLESTGKMKTMDPDYIVSLASDVPLASNAVEYAKIVAAKSMQRRMLKASSEIARLAYEPEGSVSSALDEAEKRIFDLVQHGNVKSYRGIGEILPEVYDKLNELSAKLTDPSYEGNKLSGIPSGFTKLDELLSGFQDSDLILIAARPGMGKTALMLNIATNIAAGRYKYPVAVFNLEMSSMQLTRRIVSSHTGIPGERLRSGELDRNEWVEIKNMVKDFKDIPLYIDDSADVSINSIRAKCRKLKLEKDIKLVIIDYLQLLTSGTRTESRVNEVGEISRALKLMAKELDIPIIVGSQLSRSVEKRDDKRPMLSDLRESGTIEQDADIVMFIYRDAYYHKNEESKFKDVAEILVSKHRNGALGRIELLYDSDHALFKNLSYATENKSSKQNK
ncbi:MAG: replicative DNA helicase [Clostridia bacterium]|nr:replicative DNA helicase [Clostridia bacterium]